MAEVFLGPIFLLICPYTIKNKKPTSPAIVPILNTVEYSTPAFSANAGAVILDPSLTIPT